MTTGDGRAYTLAVAMSVERTWPSGRFERSLVRADRWLKNRRAGRVTPRLIIGWFFLTEALFVLTGAAGRGDVAGRWLVPITPVLVALTAMPLIMRRQRPVLPLVAATVGLGLFWRGLQGWYYLVALWCLGTWIGGRPSSGRW